MTANSLCLVGRASPGERISNFGEENTVAAIYAWLLKRASDVFDATVWIKLGPEC
jgi:hypothetical protein